MTEIVKAPLVVAKTEDGSDVYLYEGAAVPSHVTTEHAALLREAGMIGDAPEQAAPADQDAVEDRDLLKGKVDDILDHVGDNVDLARRLLVLEAGEGGKNRSGLVRGLQEAIEAADQAGA